MGAYILAPRGLVPQPFWSAIRTISFGVMECKDVVVLLQLSSSNHISLNRHHLLNTTKVCGPGWLEILGRHPVLEPALA